MTNQARELTTATASTGLTIQQASESTGLSVHTLRYYERIGLLTSINRAANGHRRYSQADIERIGLFNHLRLTGMPLDEIRRYSLLLQYGEDSFPERHAILSAHRAVVEQQIADLQEMVAFIDYKLTLYCKSETKDKAKS